MQISFNPAINFQNHKVRNQQNNISFKKVNTRYYKLAEESYSTGKDLTSEWYAKITDGVALWKNISKQDALDTMNAVRQWVGKDSIESYDSTYNFIKFLI